MRFATVALLVLSGQAFAHYTFPSLIVNGVTMAPWQYVRKTNNFNTRRPVTDLNDINLRCYTSETKATASTLDVSANSTIGFGLDRAVFHKGVLNVYMAKVPQGSTAASWDGSGKVWFKVYEISAKTNGGSSITFPTDQLSRFEFKIPNSLPSGQYLIRVEHIALHNAADFGEAQLYVACGQLNVSGGGSGNPGPLVAIPGVYDGNEPGILIDIYYPIPATYTQPGPAIWTGQ
ncbi:glycoside hydrolase family 61 protein [Pterulicium gracile]|uniref:lytic cellulose monooxygenase (C4-dehydrogenating) n=1 Tax=Pterulicium gracile TaxID=1884261 RepID=A0A5C3QJJ3_9AGAR|nr:glycoside hydrolase family 61 protein [Pterula gracilis]